VRGVDAHVGGQLLVLLDGQQRRVVLRVSLDGQSVAFDGVGHTPGARAVWIADSGFWPFGYWCGFDQVATLIPPKGYTYADAAP
jgi:hypothetical protein